MKKKGIRKDCYHIDRINPDGGYSIDNIRLLTNTENVKRHVRFLRNYNEEKRQMEFYTSVITENYDLTNVPF